MSYTTVYTKTVRRRKTKQLETVGCQYTTKSLTDMHDHLRKSYPDAKTYKDASSVITDFIIGCNLGILPIVVGGELVA